MGPWAGSGLLGATNNTPFCWRNAANTADVCPLFVDNYNQLNLGDGNTAAIVAKPNLSLNNYADSTYYFGLSSGATAAQNVWLQFKDRSTALWELRKLNDNNFYLYDTANSATREEWIAGAGSIYYALGSGYFAYDVAGVNIFNIKSTGLQVPAFTTAGIVTNTSGGLLQSTAAPTGCPAGTIQFPCLVGNLADTSYSSTSSSGSTTLATPPVAGNYRVCGRLTVTVAASASTQASLIFGWTAYGHAFGNGPSVTATNQWSAQDICYDIYVDASTAVTAYLYLNGVTGSPTFHYLATLEKVQ
jgi:hypothetical protein